MGNLRETTDDGELKFRITTSNKEWAEYPAGMEFRGYLHTNIAQHMEVLYTVDYILIVWKELGCFTNTQ